MPRTGRPSGFKPEYCQMLLDHAEKGLSFEAFAGVLRKPKQTLYNWIDAHPEFMDAKKCADALTLLFWEKAGIDGLYDITEFTVNEVTGKETRVVKKLNAAVWIFNMRNRAGWRDSVQVSTETDKPIQIAFVPMSKRAKTDG